MLPQPRRASLRRAEARLWTGSLGHLLGGALDVLTALTRHWSGRALRRAATRAQSLWARLARAHRSQLS